MFFAALLGGIAMYMWEYIAYEFLPLGMTAQFRKLPNDTAVLAALQNNIAENSGIYIFPDVWLGPNPEGKEAGTKKDFAEKVARHPSGILIYNAAVARLVEKSRLMVVGFLTVLAQALVTVFLRSQISLRTFGARLGFVLLIGVMAAISTNLGYWNRYGFPWSYTFHIMLIQVVGFFCIALVAAFILKEQTFEATSVRRFFAGGLVSDTSWLIDLRFESGLTTIHLPAHEKR
jgi:hypothetical protein